MADVGFAGGGPGGDGAIGGEADARQLLSERRALLADFLRGNVNLSIIINNDAVVTLYLADSGRVDSEELKGYMVPQDYENDNVATMQKIITLLNLYHRLSVKRRKILFLRLIALKGVRGVSQKDALVQEDAAVKDYLQDKDEVWESYHVLKKTKADFLREPAIFKKLPHLQDKS